MNKDPLEIQHQQYDPYEDEIELMDYLKVLWKWKYLIILGTLSCAVIAGIVSFNMTKIYSVKTILAPGVAKVAGDGKITYIGSPQEIKTLIETGALEATVLKQVKGEDPPQSLSFKTTVPKGSNALEVTYETPRTDLGLQIMTLLNQAMLQKFDAIVQYFNEEATIQIGSKASESTKIIERIDTAKIEIATSEAESTADISRKKNEILTTKARIAAKEAQIENMKKRIQEIQMEIGRISKNTDLLIEERNKFLGRKTTDDNVLSAVVYSNTIQQNISYLNELRGETNRMQDAIYNSEAAVDAMKNKVKDTEAQMVTLKELTKYKTETRKAEITALESEQSFIAEEIKNLEFKKNYVQNIQILQPPKGSLSPIKPKKKLNVLLAGVVGLFLTVFLAFFIEYISRHKNNEKDR
jgi:polysaccharide biosynthesis transport protein